ncbi:hypothetical protein GOODEAATRI_012768 [Goodea atripinnis]|uniref:Uncharacterized protein n=1 Tax=Goodea atripinnis TaxID=208336 RepID=A0ABV0P5I1_9TELE
MVSGLSVIRFLPEPSALIRDPQADFSVEPSSSAEGRIQGVRPVGGPDHQNLRRHGRTVQVNSWATILLSMSLEATSLLGVMASISSMNKMHGLEVCRGQKGLGQQGLSTARRPMQEETPGRNHPKVLVHLRMTHMYQQLTHLLQ